MNYAINEAVRQHMIQLIVSDIEGSVEYYQEAKDADDNDNAVWFKDAINAGVEALKALEVSSEDLEATIGISFADIEEL